MFRFENPDNLYYLVVIPILILFFLIALIARKRAIAKFGETSLMKQLMPKMSRYKHPVKFSLLMLVLAFLVVGWANPQWGSKKEKVKRKSLDVFIALDISQSMMAEDIPPNRMERAKKFAQDLVEELKGERIGIIIFAGNAYLQMPLTTDYAAAQLFLRSANPEMAPSQGTAISDAIELAEQSFEEENKHHKVLIVISDGENHEEAALERAEQANDNGLLIYTIGAGTEEGSFIPVNYGARQDYKRDKTGNPVRSRINEQILKDIAAEGVGQYFNILRGQEVSLALRNSIEQLEKREFETRSFEDYESYFQYFIAAALFFLIIEFLISYRKSAWLEGKDIFS